jgi:MFS superfamily sulfate permease-like transporter
MVVLGRRDGTTSWEPITESDVSLVDHALVALFDNDLFFANAGIFRRELHQLLATYPTTQHFVFDAVAMAEIDFTGMTILSQVVADLEKDHVTMAFARVSTELKETLAKSFDPAIQKIPIYESVDEAVTALVG